MKFNFDKLSQECQHFIPLAEVLSGKKEYPFNPGGENEIVLTLNGVELPFEKTIKELYYIIYQNLKVSAAELAMWKNSH